jgi:hypothetical protein
MKSDHDGSGSLGPSPACDEKAEEQFATGGVQATHAAASLWASENAGAIREYNEFVRLHGIPLSEFRNF